MIQRNVAFDFSRSTGKMKPVAAVNGGTLATPALSVDLSDSFREMAVPAVRTNSVPSERVVDVHTLFPNFELDERFEASFNFAPTDEYLRAVKNVGAEIYLRLGDTPEPYEVKRHADLPESYEKWASVCERIIAHYNEGWGRGFKLGIKYVEIAVLPVEPDPLGPPMREYFELYRTVAERLRARFPRIRIGAYYPGGFRALNHYDATDAERAHVELLDAFLSFVTAKETSAPLDFLAWRCRADTPEELSLHSSYAKNYLAQSGLKKTQSVVAEFNLSSVGESYRAKEYPARLVSSLILAQKSDISMMFYDNADPLSPDCALYSLEDRSSVHTYAAYRAMCAFGRLAVMKNTVLCTEDYRHTIYSLGATDGTEGAILLSTCDYNGVIEILVEGASFTSYSISGITGGGERGDGYFTSAENVPLSDGRIRVRAGKNEVYLIILK